MRILVTGPFGQDARCIFSELSKVSGYQLYGVSNKPINQKNITSEKELIGVTILRRDLSKNSECVELLNTIKPDVIFHLAAVHGSSATMEAIEEDFSSSMWKCHFEITKNITDWISLHPLTRLVYAGSSQMFLGHESGMIISEETPPSAINEYGKTKLAGWNLLKSLRDERHLHLSCGILFNHTSEFSKPEFLFPEIAIQISKAIKSKGGGIEIRHPNALLDVSSAQDIAHGLILMSRNEYGGDFVLGSGTQKSIASIISSVIQKLNLNYPIHIEASVSDKEINCLVSNPNKALNLLSWKAIDSPEDILMRMITSRNFDKYCV